MKLRKILLVVLTVACLFNGVPSLTVSAAGTDDFVLLRNRLFDFYTGGSDSDSSDPDIASRILSVNSKAQQDWDAMVKDSGRTYLWSDLSSTTVSSAVSGSYGRLKEMALAYSTNGAALYGNAALLADIVSGMDWMYMNRYNMSVPVRGYDNWYDWQISSPLSINTVIDLLYSRLSAEQINDWEAVIDRQELPLTASNTGANRIWTCNIMIVSGILTMDGQKITDGVSGTGSVLEYVTSGEGFYQDGSFLQHTALIPYNGGYGLSTVDYLSQLMYMVSGSPWDFTDPNIEHVYQWIYSAFEPLFCNDGMMEMVDGREIARAVNDNAGLTSVGMLGSAVARLAGMTDSAADAARLKSMLKEWMDEATSSKPYDSLDSIQAVEAVKAIMQDAGVSPRGDLVLDKQYPNMARTVHRRPGWVFGISMSSNKIANYESLNGENLSGWHTGDGMTYLYDGDTAQYEDGFWPTVDSHRLPGTTVIQNATAAAQQKNGSNWVGGTSLDDLYGATGMQLKTSDGELSAYKSWFLFDDEVVNLGAGIQSTADDAPVESIVENRKLDAAGDNALTVNGVSKSSALGWSENMSDVKWVHLSGNTAGSDVGYYFPDSTELRGLREARTGQWSQINSYYSNPVKNPEYFTDITRSYLTLWIDHGVAASGAGYEYVLLPNQSAAQVQQYADHPDITVLENSTQAQAVKENKLGILAVNFWQDASKTVAGVTSNKKASVMLKTGSDGSELTVADPTMANTGTIELTLDMDVGALAYADSGISVRKLGSQTQIIANVNGMNGGSLKVRFYNPGDTSSDGPDTPDGFAAGADTENTVHLSWNPVDGATDYRLYRSDSADGTYVVPYRAAGGRHVIHRHRPPQRQGIFLSGGGRRRERNVGAFAAAAGVDGSAGSRRSGSRRFGRPDGVPVLEPVRGSSGV